MRGLDRKDTPSVIKKVDAPVYRVKNITTGKVIAETLREADARSMMLSAKRNNKDERFCVTDKRGVMLFS